MTDEDNNAPDARERTRDSETGPGDWTSDERPQDAAPGSDETTSGQGDTPETSEGATEAHSPADGPEPDADPEQEDRDKGIAKVRREAQGLRQRLRDTELERDDARAAVQRLQRAAVAKAAGLPDASILERVGLDVSELVDADGLVDERAALAELDRVRRSLGLPAAGARPGRGGGGLDGGADHRGGGEDALVAALRPRRR